MKNNSNIPSKAEIKKLYESYAEYFAIVMENIIDILHAEVKLNAQPTYKSRVKSFNSYYKKILRLKPEETKGCSDSLVLLTDMMGIRMICAFLEDMQLGLEQIKKTFEIKEMEVKGAEKKSYLSLTQSMYATKPSLFNSLKKQIILSSSLEL